MNSDGWTRPDGVPLADIHAAKAAIAKITTEFRVGGIGDRVVVTLDGRRDIDKIIVVLHDAIECARVYRDRLPFAAGTVTFEVKE